MRVCLSPIGWVSLGLAYALAAWAPRPVRAQHEHTERRSEAPAARHRMSRTMPMLPAMQGVVPSVTPFLPGQMADPSSVPESVPRRVVDLSDGDTLDLQAMIVRRGLNGRTFTMYGFNGQHPGPLIRVRQNTSIVVRLTNRLDLPTTVHWHGVRVQNAFDGVPGLTQEAVQPGETFVYHVRFPDAGIYWYHPHIREDIQQDLGLYGNILVAPTDGAGLAPVNRQEVLALDDILIEADSIVPYGAETPNFALMGRFGNVLLVNGEPHYHLRVPRGAVVRFFLTNVANARHFNVWFGGARTKVVGSDLGLFERDAWVESVGIAPAERYIVDVRFDQPGSYEVRNRVQALDHFLGEFYPEEQVLGIVEVTPDPVAEDYSAAFATLRERPDVKAEMDGYRLWLDREPDRSLILTVRVRDLPLPMVQFLTLDTAYFRPVEWNDPMPDMNWVSTGREVQWILRDAASGRENMDIDWRFPRGTVAKIRFVNDARSFHPMDHPVHFHGQRLLVLARDGVPNPNLVWKDTFVVPVGSTVDVLVELKNPGRWMVHCHVAEHLAAGMMGTFAVED